MEGAGDLGNGGESGRMGEDGIEMVDRVIVHYDCTALGQSFLCAEQWVLVRTCIQGVLRGLLVWWHVAGGRNSNRCHPISTSKKTHPADAPEKMSLSDLCELCEDRGRRELEMASAGAWLSGRPGGPGLGTYSLAFYATSTAALRGKYKQELPQRGDLRYDALY